MSAIMSHKDTKAGQLQRAVLKVWKEHQVSGMLPTSGRFIYYELVSRGVVDKTQTRRRGRGADQDVADALLRLREARQIPWEDIVDETRHVYRYTGSASILAGLRADLQVIRLDPWDGSPAPLILCESRSLSGALGPVADEYCCPIAATNGQAHGFLVTEISRLLDLPRPMSRPVLYLGDLDLSGGHIERNTRSVLVNHAHRRLDWERLAITDDQVGAYGLESFVVSKVDGRHVRSRKLCCTTGERPGHSAVETEALRQDVLVQVLRSKLDSLLPSPLADVLVRENEQREAAARRLDGEP